MGSQLDTFKHPEASWGLVLPYTEIPNGIFAPTFGLWCQPGRLSSAAATAGTPLSLWTPIWACWGGLGQDGETCGPWGAPSTGAARALSLVLTCGYQLGTAHPSTLCSIRGMGWTFSLIFLIQIQGPSTPVTDWVTFPAALTSVFTFLNKIVNLIYFLLRSTKKHLWLLHTYVKRWSLPFTQGYQTMFFPMHTATNISSHSPHVLWGRGEGRTSSFFQHASHFLLLLCFPAPLKMEHPFLFT